MKAEPAMQPPSWSSEHEWARSYGIDLSEFVPFNASAIGTHTMTLAEAALDLGMSGKEVRHRLRDGTLRGASPHGAAGWRVSRVDVRRLGRVNGLQPQDP